MSQVARRIDPQTRPQTAPRQQTRPWQPHPEGPRDQIPALAGPSRGPIDHDGGATRSSRIDHGRALAESVLHRAEWLSPGDRQLVRSIYADGHPVSRLAPMLRMRERSLARRVRRLLERLNSRRFAFVAVRHERWPATRKRVAASVILQGHSLRRTADTLRLSLYSVRRHYDAINALFEAGDGRGA